MHLLIPFASALSERGRQALRSLRLPHLAKLLARLQPTERLGTDEYSLSPPHERTHAQALGWQGDDGTLPWAARQAKLDGIDIGAQAWGLLTPVHWHVGADHVTLLDPAALHLSAQDSRAMFEAVRPLFESEGWSMAWGAPQRWYAAHDTLEKLPTASLDRVIGRNIELWMPTAPQAKLIRRLQNEVQMLLYQQPLNDHRVAQGHLPVNSFWLSGCGRAQGVADESALVIPNHLRTPLLSSNWAAWTTAWQALDAGPVREALLVARRGEPVTLTLCGERLAQRFERPPAGGLWAKLNKRLTPPPVAPMLEAL